MNTIHEGSVCKYSLTIKPAIPTEHRHKLEDTLKQLNYNIIGGGTHTDNSECDISFETKR